MLADWKLGERAVRPWISWKSIDEIDGVGADANDVEPYPSLARCHPL